MKRIIIDCDPGVDDAQAIMMAYQHPEVTIEAITTVAGNVGVDKTTANALKILDVLGAGPIPVYPGVASGLVEHGENASVIHGEDGLGDANIPVSVRSAEEKPAAQALIDLAKENPGKLGLIAIGPLTNLALALRLEPKLPTYYERLVIMGGAYLGQGNTSNPPAEFNIYADPDAAAVVFSSWPELTMVSWEATVAHGMPIENFKALCHFDNPCSRFLEQITQKTLAFLQNVLKDTLSYSADPLAMAVMMEPEIITEVESKWVDVERYGQLTRGMTVVDWYGFAGKKPNTHIVKQVNQDRFYELLRMAFE